MFSGNQLGLYHPPWETKEHSANLVDAIYNALQMQRSCFASSRAREALDVILGLRQLPTTWQSTMGDL
eukprot:4651811-Amphidinium_carterae.1